MPSGNTLPACLNSENERPKTQEIVRESFLSVCVLYWVRGCVYQGRTAGHWWWCFWLTYWHKVWCFWGDCVFCSDKLTIRNVNPSSGKSSMGSAALGPQNLKYTCCLLTKCYPKMIKTKDQWYTYRGKAELNIFTLFCSPGRLLIHWTLCGSTQERKLQPCCRGFELFEHVRKWHTDHLSLLKERKQDMSIITVCTLFLHNKIFWTYFDFFSKQLCNELNNVKQVFLIKFISHLGTNVNVHDEVLVWDGPEQQIEVPSG